MDHDHQRETAVGDRRPFVRFINDLEQISTIMRALAKLWYAQILFPPPKSGFTRQRPAARWEAPKFRCLPAAMPFDMAVG